MSHPTEVVRDRSQSTGPARAVLYALATRGVTCWPSLDTIAADAGVSRSTAIRAIRELVEAGEVVIIRGKPRRYHLVICCQDPGCQGCQSDTFDASEGCQSDTPQGVNLTPQRCQSDTCLTLKRKERGAPLRGAPPDAHVRAREAAAGASSRGATPRDPDHAAGSAAGGRPAAAAGNPEEESGPWWLNPILPEDLPEGLRTLPWIAEARRAAGLDATTCGESIVSPVEGSIGDRE